MPVDVTYRVWRKQTAERSQTEWIMTAHTIVARTDAQAARKLKARFVHAGFSHMRLVACPPGVDPNEPVSRGVR